MQIKDKYGLSLIIAALLAIIIMASLWGNGCNAVNGLGKDIATVTEPYVN